MLPGRLVVVFNTTLESVVLDEVRRGGVLIIDPSDESESTSVPGGPVGLELRGGDRGLPMFFRLLSLFSKPPERQWTFFGDEDPLTGRQGGSTEGIATRRDVDLQRPSLALRNYAGLERCVGCSANEDAQWMSNASSVNPGQTEMST